MLPDQSSQGHLSVSELHDQVVHACYVTQQAPEGAQSFSLPSIVLGPMVVPVVNMALNQIALAVGSTVEQVALSHRDQILAIVPQAVLSLVADIATKLEQPPQS